jgi:CubicO group peptidase (beta-lactamase class C family)
VKRPLVAVAVFALALSACSSDSDSTPKASPRATDATTTVAGAGTSAGSAEDLVYPGDDWAVADPADHGIDPAGLEAARAYAFEPEHHTQGVVVIRGGEIVGEWYAEGSDAESWAASWSMAKSFTSATVGIAIDEGAIGSVDDPAAKYLTAWAGTEHDRITVKDLLQMNSGIDWDEDYRGIDAEIVRMVTGQPDQLAFAMSVPQGVEPGTRWSYSSGDSMILGGVVQAATGERLDQYAKEKLLDPIGIDQVEWWRDARGHTLGYCCFDTTSRDFARLGLLYLHHGRWKGKQIVPERWVEDTIEPVADSHGEYGYQWWTYDIDGVPKDTFLAEGIDGQFIYVIPSLDLIVVRSGTYVKDPGPPIADPNLFLVYPSGSLVPGKGTSEPEDWDSSAFLTPIIDAIHD